MLVIPFPNEHACRLAEPIKDADFARKNGEREHDGKKYDVIYQRGKDGSMHQQAFRYPKETWSAKEAGAHCSDHGGSFEAAKDTAIKLFKSNDEKQIVYGVVFEPDFVFEADSNFKEEQIISKEHIEEAAHNYLIKLRREGGLSHQKLSHGQAIDHATDIVESSVVHVDFKMGEELIKEGSWIIGMKIYDKELWKETKKSLTGFSAGGSAEIL